MYEIMTPGPTQVRENVLAARSLPCTNPDLDPDFYTFYKETCELISALLHTKNEALIWAARASLAWKQPVPVSRSRATGCWSSTMASSAKALRTL